MIQITNVQMIQMIGFLQKTIQSVYTIKTRIP